MRWGAALAIGAVAAAVLAGCTAQSGFATIVPALGREQSDDDALPAEFGDPADSEVDPASIRFVGEVDGVRFWVGTAGDRAVCGLILDPATGASTGCGGVPTQGGGGGHEYYIGGEPDGSGSWTQLAEGYWAR